MNGSGYDHYCGCSTSVTKIKNHHNQGTLPTAIDIKQSYKSWFFMVLRNTEKQNLVCKLSTHQSLEHLSIFLEFGICA